MSAFKELMESDLALFLNPDEHGETHKINGADVVCIVDKDGASGRNGSGQRYDGTFKNIVTVFVRESVLADKPVYNQLMTVDGSRYRVEIADLVGGLYEISLEAVR